MHEMRGTGLGALVLAAASAAGLALEAQELVEDDMPEAFDLPGFSAAIPGSPMELPSAEFAVRHPTRTLVGRPTPD